MKCKLTEISKSYQDRVILDCISYDFSENGMYVIYGKSGIGKSTLLNILCGYEACDSGVIETETDNIVYALQNYELLDGMSVADNLSVCKSFYPNDFVDPYNTMRVLKVDHLMNQYPNELSKGQKQRIMVVKALCRSADIYLFDEPTSALDKEAARSVMNLLYEKAKTAIVIVVSHDLSLIDREKTTLLEIKQGKLLVHAEQKGLVHTKNVTEADIQKVNIDSVMKRILKRQSRKMMLIYCLFSVMILMMLMININRYQWKVYNDLYQEEYLYVKDNNYNRTMKDSASVMSFLDYDTGTNTFPIHAMPSHRKNDFERLKDGGIIINQNTAQFFEKRWELKQSELIGKTFYLEYSDGIYKKQVPFHIIDIIEERDAHTRATAYYDVSDLKKRIEHFEDISTQYYEIQAASESIEQLYAEKDRQGITVFHPMLSDKYEMAKQGVSEDVILWLLIGIVLLFYAAAVYFVQRNHWKYHLISNITLVNDGIECETVRNSYQRVYNRSVLAVTALAVEADIVCYGMERNAVLLIFGGVFIMLYLLNRALLKYYSAQLQMGKIAELLKAGQEIK